MNTSLYDKRDDFKFSITNFPILSCNIPSSPAYGVFMSQLIRYDRASTKYTDFVLRARRLSDKLLSQGYVCDQTNIVTEEVLWFCPSVFIYLASTVPAIWFLELHEMEKRINFMNPANKTTTLHQYNETLDDLRADLGKVLGVNLEIRLPIKLSPDQWIRTLEQLLLLLLILGRWILPKGKLTHDQLSQLLLVYIGTAADIVEFFEAFKEEEVRYNRLLCIIILGLWSFSLIQFTLVLTASRARRDQSGLLTRQYNYTAESDGCCASDVYGILISILLQDLPFLVLRLLLIFKFHVLSYTNMFFTSKNTLVILLLLYRLIVVQIERRAAINKEHVNNLHFENPRPMMSSRYNGPGIPRSKSVTCMNYVMPADDKAKLMQRKSSNVNGSLNHMNLIKNHPPKIYKLRQDKNDMGRNYHFEEIDSPV
ncbi:hypothetical protein FSP39_008452 [Pinctada imbricata]|uniref:Transmembrane protein 26 n=1 Tax=Pinctada imbricata TaxID=66713 RepID=A0AA88YFZ7_PINIB|nr:hypothetical protein FSP39_008452 [Pinctada imbricata]